MTPIVLSMDWLVVILLNLASNGLTEMALFGGREIQLRRRRRAEIEPLPDALQSAIEAAIKSVVSEAKVPPSRVDELKQFLQSSDVQATVRQIYASRIGTNGGSASLEVEKIRERFIA